MKDKVKRFEILVLRPLLVAFTFFGIVFLVRSHWLCFSVCIFGAFYVGIIGTKLHPLQSAIDLATGPLTGSAALVEVELLNPAIKNTLVDHACFRVGVVIGVAVGVYSLVGLGWHWYFA